MNTSTWVRKRKERMNKNAELRKSFRFELDILAIMKDHLSWFGHGECKEIREDVRVIVYEKSTCICFN